MPENQSRTVVTITGARYTTGHDAQNNQDALLCGLHTLVTKEESLVDVPDHHDDCNRGKDCLEQVINALSTLLDFGLNRSSRALQQKQASSAETELLRRSTAGQ